MPWLMRPRAPCFPWSAAMAQRAGRRKAQGVANRRVAASSSLPFNAACPRVKAMPMKRHDPGVSQLRHALYCAGQRRRPRWPPGSLRLLQT